MCGIVGVLQKREAVSPAVLKAMTEALVHRGPDDSGQLIDNSVGLGHRRLSVIDLSEAGRQPMSNEDGSIVIVYNGELYNFPQLRPILQAKGYKFHSKTDTEVLLAAYCEWGVDCLQKLNGMFAFAVLDKRNRTLVLARDRAGIKPLYYYQRDGLFAFASEIKALLKHPAISARLNLESLAEYMSFQNLFGEQTLFDGVKLLPPGSFLRIPIDSSKEASISAFWRYTHSAPDAFTSENECAEELSGLLGRVVSSQLISDAPLGTYLSGGIDSGAIAANAAQSIDHLTSFTAGFDLSSASGLELGFDERPAAEVMANLFKTEHYEVVLHAGDMERVLPNLIWQLEDLRVGQSYPNYYVARLASKFVKVVLSGVGGDELFGGYPWRYFRHKDAKNRDEFFANYFNYWQRLVPESEANQLLRDEVRAKIGGFDAFGCFKNVFDDWNGPLEDSNDFIAASLYFEFRTFLHGLLIVEDKLSMAHSLETRVPFLDNDLIDFALKTPLNFKIKLDGPIERIDENVIGKRRAYEGRYKDGKTVLRNATSRLLPPEIVDRTKQGFSAPDASWFRGESIDYINRLLRDPKARINDYIQPSYIEYVLERHCSGAENRRLLIWSLLSLEWWCRLFLK